MPIKIVFQNAEGGVSITPLHDTLSVEEWAAHIVPAGVSWRLVDDANIPNDRKFRNAWALDGTQIKEDFAKSVEITKARLRKERKPLLEAADIKALKDIEATGAVSPETAALKQTLRDVTALADAAKSRDELLALSVAAVIEA